MRPNEVCNIIPFLFPHIYCSQDASLPCLVRTNIVTMLARGIQNATRKAGNVSRLVNIGYICEWFLTPVYVAA